MYCSSCARSMYRLFISWETEKQFIFHDKFQIFLVEVIMKLQISLTYATFRVEFINPDNRQDGKLQLYEHIFIISQYKFSGGCCDLSKPHLSSVVRSDSLFPPQDFSTRTSESCAPRIPERNSVNARQTVRTFSPA